MTHIERDALEEINQMAGFDALAFRLTVGLDPG